MLIQTPCFVCHYDNFIGFRIYKPVTIMKNFSLPMKHIFIEIQRNLITLKPWIKIMYIILYTFTCSFFKVIALMFPNIANEPSIFRYPKIVQKRMSIFRVKFFFCTYINVSFIFLVIYNSKVSYNRNMLFSISEFNSEILSLRVKAL